MLEEQKPRRVVPRWRSSSVAAKTSEVLTPPRKTQISYEGELANKLLEFDSIESVPVASELMFLALQAGSQEAARTAAALIVKNESQIGATRLVATAKKVLNAAEVSALVAPAGDFVREARKLLALDFRNPVLLIDIARELTARGQERAALRYVRAAVALAPKSRFVVRSAARYFLHVGEHDQAHSTLLRSPLLATYPWVQASEIAVATVRGKTSMNLKTAQRVVAAEHAVGTQYSELFSAVATVEFVEGSNKKAKQLFQKALAHPNDNSLAQIEWAASKLKLVVDESALRTPFSFEANSNNSYRRLLMPQAIDFAKQWSTDEPFASRPFETLCYLYSLEERYEEALQAAQDAIRVDDSWNFPSQLNLMFTRVQNGDLDTGYADLLRLAKHPEAKAHAAHLLANAGALAYATGERALGREFYERAIRAARAKGEPHTEALARAFYARAAAHHSDEQAPTIIDLSAKAVERLPSAGAIYVVKALTDPKTQTSLDIKASARVAKRRWEWDAATNTLHEL
jgi:hypothetical protein